MMGISFDQSSAQFSAKSMAKFNHNFSNWLSFLYNTLGFKSPNLYGYEYGNVYLTSSLIGGFYPSK